MLAIASLFTPPIVDRLRIRAAPIIKHRGWIAAALAVSFFVVIGNVAEGAAERGEHDRAARDSIAAVRDSLRGYVAENRQDILDEASVIAERRSVAAASAFLQRFAVAGDSLVDAARNSYDDRAKEERAAQREREILERLRSVPASDAAQNNRLYSRLVQLRPQNDRYRERRDHYGAIVQREREENERLAAYRGPRPEPSAWDGSYREVKNYLEVVMHDPSSLEIIGCTPVYTTEEGWLVGCDYRGSNAFGGIVRQSNWFIIRQGRVVEAKPASAYSP